MRIFRLYQESVYSTLEMYVAASSRKQAVKAVIKYITESKDYDEEYFDWQDIDDGIEEFTTEDNVVIADLSKFVDI